MAWRTNSADRDAFFSSLLIAGLCLSGGSYLVWSWWTGTAAAWRILGGSVAILIGLILSGVALWLGTESEERGETAELLSATLRKLKSRDPSTRSLGLQRLVTSRDLPALDHWQPAETPLKVLRAVALGRWHEAATISTEGLDSSLPFIVKALERHPYSDAIRDSNAKAIEDLIASFTREPALPHLISALDTNLLIASRELSRRTLSEATTTETVGGGSWNGSWEGEQQFLVRQIEHTYGARSPIAEGAIRALQAIADQHGGLRPVISAAIDEYRKRPERHLTKVTSETESLGSPSVTYSEHDGR